MARRPGDPVAPPFRAAARTTDRHRFNSWLATTGVTFFWAWSREAQATEAAAMRNPRQDKRRITQSASQGEFRRALHVIAWNSGGWEDCRLRICGVSDKCECCSVQAGGPRWWRSALRREHF